MWTTTMPSHPWQWVGGLLIRQGHGARQQQPMMRVPSSFHSGAAADSALGTPEHPAEASRVRKTKARFMGSPFFRWREDAGSPAKVRRNRRNSAQIGGNPGTRLHVDPVGPVAGPADDEGHRHRAPA